MIPLGIKDIAVLVGAGLLAVGGWTARGWYEDSQDLAQAQAIEQSRELLRELAGDIATKTETAIGGIRVENRTIYTTAQKEILRETVYRDCVLPDAGRLLVNSARQGRAAAGKPDDAVRPAQPAP